MIKVLVVDDSAFMRKVITGMLSSEPDISVVATAVSGTDALKKIDELSPDIVTMDFEMPDMNGIDVIRKVMAKKPLPIILITGTSQPNATIDALQAGAVDFILKPSGTISLDMDKVKLELVSKIRAAHTIRTGKILLHNPGNVDNAKSMSLTFRPSCKKLIVIAASTGGPQTLENLLKQFPKNTPAPILVVQHMPAKFTASLALRLSKVCSIQVREAADGDLVQDGVALIAPGDFHMQLALDKTAAGYTERIAINKDAPELGVRPNANKLFISAAQIYKENTVAIVLTGMGNDGTEGCKVIKSMHGLVIAQSEDSCIIYGMPKSVVDSRLADMVLPVEKIGPALMQILDL